MVWASPLDVGIGVFVLIFLGIGIWLGTRFQTPDDPFLVKSDPERDKASVSLDSPPSVSISQREQEVLELVAEGCSNQEIADRLFISVTTVKSHLTNIYAKLEVSRRTQAVQKARALQLVSN